MAHSAEYFTAQRDFWWHADFIALMARRWRLETVRSALEIGAGVGHWSRVLAPQLPPEATLIGIDREPQWVDEANRRSPSPRFSYRHGDAMQLPFAEASFDFVTCQTVLIHLPDVPAALAEMKRVLKPGGLLVVAEPNNLGSALAQVQTQSEADIDRALRLAKLQILCERGKAALGLGFNSVGEKLPAMVKAAGFDELQVYNSDHVTSLVPPYETAAERATVAQTLEWAGRDFFIWSREETRQYYLAGGGTDATFETLWDDARVENAKAARELREGTAASAGGGLFYLISGRLRADKRCTA
jgi:SAM-dependent methyltransferase